MRLKRNAVLPINLTLEYDAYNPTLLLRGRSIINFLHNLSLSVSVGTSVIAWKTLIQRYARLPHILRKQVQCIIELID